MKRLLFALFFLTNLTIYGASSPRSSEDYLVIRNDDDNYTVIYVNMDNRSKSTARKRAIRKAAEVGRENGYQYFVVDQKEDVLVGRTGRGQSPPRNIYQELIVEDDFGPSTSDDPIYYQREGVFRGYKIKVTYYRDNAPRGAIKVCRMVQCYNG